MNDRTPCEVLDWDSRHFGLKIGRVRTDGLTGDMLEAIDRWRLTHGMDCLYLLAPVEHPAIVRIAEQAGFGLADARVTLDRAPTGETFEEAQEPIRPIVSDDLPILKEMARRLHHDSRFHTDARFPADRSAEMFALWIEHACADPAHRVFVADLNDRAAGYIACQRTGRGTGRIQLLGVDTFARGKGLGTRLVAAAADWLSHERVSRVTVVTQGRNISALRLYNRCGFATASIALWYHWWSPRYER